MKKEPRPKNFLPLDSAVAASATRTAPTPLDRPSNLRSKPDLLQRPLKSAAVITPKKAICLISSPSASAGGIETQGGTLDFAVRNLDSLTGHRQYYGEIQDSSPPLSLAMPMQSAGGSAPRGTVRRRLVELQSDSPRSLEWSSMVVEFVPRTLAASLKFHHHRLPGVPITQPDPGFRRRDNSAGRLKK